MVLGRKTYLLISHSFLLLRFICSAVYIFAPSLLLFLAFPSITPFLIYRPAVTKFLHIYLHIYLQSSYLYIYVGRYINTFLQASSGHLRIFFPLGASFRSRVTKSQRTDMPSFPKCFMHSLSPLPCHQQTVHICKHFHSDVLICAF